MRNREEVARLFNRLTVPDSLLPLSIENLRLSLPIMDSLEIKAIPGEQNLKTLRDRDIAGSNEFSEFQTIAKRDGMGYIAVDRQEPFLLMRKLSPHAQHEVMLISASPRVKTAIDDFSSETRQLLFQTINRFAQFAKVRGLYPYVTYNFTPPSFDREIGQSERRYHIHCIGRTPEELAEINNNTRELRAIDPVRQRRLVDETSIIAASILYDYVHYHKPFQCIEAVPPITTTAVTPGLLFRIGSGWESMNSEDFIHDMEKLHKTIEHLYNDFVRSVTTGKSGAWQRPQLIQIINSAERVALEDNLRKYPWLTTQSRDIYLHMLRKLHPKALMVRDGMRQPVFKDVVIYSYPIADLCYVVSFFEINSEPYALVRFQLFTDLGGAGVQVINGIITKTRRGVGEFTSEELKQRHEFENAFKKTVSAHEVL